MSDYKVLMSKVATRGELSEDCCSGVSELLVKLKNNQELFFDYDFDIKENRTNIYVSQRSIFDNLFEQSLNQTTIKDASVVLVYGNASPINIPEYFQEQDLEVVLEMFKMLTGLLVSPYIAKELYEAVYGQKHNSQTKGVPELIAEIKNALLK